jgi:uncharacterized protein (DUF1499 family)
MRALNLSKLAQKHDYLREEGKDRLVAIMDDLFSYVGSRIEELVLRNSESVIDMTVFTLCDHDNTGYISSLDLSYCSNVTDKALKRISQYRCFDGSSLRSLWLTGCNRVTEEGLKALLTGETAKSLSSIDVSKCNRVKCISCFNENSKHCVRSLRAASCGNLRQVSLSLPSVSTIRDISLPQCEALTSVRCANRSQVFYS